MIFGIHSIGTMINLRNDILILAPIGCLRAAEEEQARFHGIYHHWTQVMDIEPVMKEFLPRGQMN